MRLSAGRIASVGLVVGLLGAGGAGFAYAQSSSTSPSTTTPSPGGGGQGHSDGDCPNRGQDSTQSSSSQL
jgi:hypothetical protein